MREINKLKVKMMIEGGRAYVSIYGGDDSEPVATLDEATTREVALKMLGALEIGLSHSLLLRWLHEHGVDKELVRRGIIECAEARKDANMETNSNLAQSFDVLVAYCAYLANEAELAGRKPLEIDDWVMEQRLAAEIQQATPRAAELPN